MMIDGCMMGGIGSMMGVMGAGMLVFTVVLVGIGFGAGYAVARRR
jgi:hypothetical protein